MLPATRRDHNRSVQSPTTARQPPTPPRQPSMPTGYNSMNRADNGRVERRYGNDDERAKISKINSYLQNTALHKNDHFKRNEMAVWENRQRKEAVHPQSNKQIMYPQTYSPYNSEDRLSMASNQNAQGWVQRSTSANNNNTKEVKRPSKLKYENW